MGQTVYADLLFLVNFSMDFLCFFVTAQILHRKFNIKRGILASALGGIYSIAVLFLKLRSIFAVVVDLLVCLILCVVAYSEREENFKKFAVTFGVFWGVSVGIGGFMTAVFNMLNKINLPFDSVKENPDKISVWLFGLLAIISGVLSIFGGRIFKNSAISEPKSVEISMNNKSITIAGMVDTGNLLKDPISGKLVILIDRNKLSSLIPEDIIEFALSGNIVEIMEKMPELKVRLITVNTANKSNLVCAFLPESIKIYDKNKKASLVDALICPCELCLNSDKITANIKALIPSALV